MWHNEVGSQCQRCQFLRNLVVCFEAGLLAKFSEMISTGTFFDKFKLELVLTMNRPQLKTVFLDLKSSEDLKRFISRMGNLWPLGFLASELRSFAVFNFSYSAVALLSFSAFQVFRISVFWVSKRESNKIKE